MVRRLSICAIGLIVSGCITAGPDYAPIEQSVPKQFDEAESSLFDTGSISSSAWANLEDDTLTDLIKKGRLANTDIRAAVARLEGSRALSGLSVFSLFPTTTASASSERSRQSSRDPFTFEGLGVSEVQQLQFDSQWEIDLFGSLERQDEQVVALVETDEALLDDIQRTVIAEVAQSYFSYRGAQIQLRVQRDGVNAQAQTVEILQKSLTAGRGTALDLARARALERSLAAALPSIEVDITRSRQRLAVLTADTSANIEDILQRQPSLQRDINFPDKIAIGSPEDWLQRRPDVRAAEREVAGATAAIGVETAEFYPKLNLLGSFGYSGTSLDDLGESDARRWSFGPSLQWRFLDFGRVRQYVQAAEASEREAIANFQGTLLRALEDMENSLAQYRSTTQTVFVLSEALEEAARATEIAQLRFDNGVSNYLEVLDAERTRLDLARQHALATTSRSTALVAVYKALAVR